MLKKTPPGQNYLQQNVLQIRCPHCDIVSTLSRVSTPDLGIINARQLKEVIAGYACDHCNRAIPILWDVVRADSGGLLSNSASEIILALEPFEFAHVPKAVSDDIKEALNCLSVKAYNGFAAMCRRTVQSACKELGAEGSTRVEQQIKELKDLADLDEETYAAIREIMLGGHAGAHPQLPSVDQNRAMLLLQLLRDMAHQLFTRPGMIKEAAAKRVEANQKK